MELIITDHAISRYQRRGKIKKTKEEIEKELTEAWDEGIPVVRRFKGSIVDRDAEYRRWKQFVLVVSDSTLLTVYLYSTKFVDGNPDGLEAN